MDGEGDYSLFFLLQFIRFRRLNGQAALPQNLFTFSGQVRQFIFVSLLLASWASWPVKSRIFIFFYSTIPNFNIPFLILGKFVSSKLALRIGPRHGWRARL